MKPNTFEMTLYLSNFEGARTVIVEDDDGRPEAGVFIPAERNALARSHDGRWITWGFVQEMDVPMLGFTHRVIHKTNTGQVCKLKDSGLEPAFIARMKPTRFYHRKKVFDTKVRFDDAEL